MALPPFGMLSALYPNYWFFPSPKTVQKIIGGEVQDPDITNTCTIRLSHAMNGAGYPIPEFWRGVTNRRGANRRYYIIRVADFRTWMERRFGAPTVELGKKDGQAIDRKQIEGFRVCVRDRLHRRRRATPRGTSTSGTATASATRCPRDRTTSLARPGVSLWHDESRATTAPV